MKTVFNLAGLVLVGYLIHHQGKRTMAALDDLRTEVEENKTVMASAVALLQGLKAKLDEAIASGDPAELKRLSDELDTNTTALAGAVSANTPAEPNP